MTTTLAVQEIEKESEKKGEVTIEFEQTVEFDEPEVKPEKKKKAKKEPKIKILFVCSGNTCRSAMAESIFKNNF